MLPATQTELEHPAAKGHTFGGPLRPEPTQIRASRRRSHFSQNGKCVPPGIPAIQSARAGRLLAIHAPACFPEQHPYPIVQIGDSESEL